MNTDTRELCVITLRALVAVKERVRFPEVGICGNLDSELLRLDLANHAADANALLRSLWVRWPKYSGNIYFPVCKNRKKDPVRAAICYVDRLAPMWDTSSRYGADRVALLDWLITELEQLVQL